MTTILLIIHLVLAVSLVALILLQRSEGGALGMGGGGSSGGGLMTGRASANFLTRTTAAVAALFMVTSLGLAILANKSQRPRSLLDEIPVEAAPVMPVEPLEPEGPVVPFGE